MHEVPEAERHPHKDTCPPMQQQSGVRVGRSNSNLERSGSNSIPCQAERHPHKDTCLPMPDLAAVLTEPGPRLSTRGLSNILQCNIITSTMQCILLYYTTI